MRRAKRAVWMLGALVVLVLAGCSGGSPYAPIGSSTAESTATSGATTETPVSDVLDQLTGHWDVTYKLTSVKPTSKRRTAAGTPDEWRCVVYNGRMELKTGARSHRGPLVMTGKAGGKGWNYKGKSDYAGPQGELWTSDLNIDGTMDSVDSFTAKQTTTLESSLSGRLYVATYSVKGKRIP